MKICVVWSVLTMVILLAGCATAPPVKTAPAKIETSAGADRFAACLLDSDSMAGFKRCLAADDVDLASGRTVARVYAHCTM